MGSVSLLRASIWLATLFSLLGSSASAQIKRPSPPDGLVGSTEPWSVSEGPATSIVAAREDGPHPGCDPHLGGGSGGSPGGKNNQPTWGGGPHGAPGELPTLAEPESHEFVAYHNGQVGIERVDLSIPGRGLDFTFSRSYNSKIASKSGATAGPMGFGWTHNFDISLERISTTIIGVRHGTTRIDPYTYQSSGPWQSPPGVFSVLIPVYSLTTLIGFDLRMPDGSELRFSVLGVLQTIKDGSDNTISLFYTSGQLTQITDTLGRTISLTYSSGLLSQVTDFTGRSVVYTYNSNQELTDVRSPIVNSTSGWNDFTSGCTEQYAYASPHLLTGIYTPRDVALSATSPTLQYVYQQWGGTGRWFCTQQIFGSDAEKYNYDTSITGVTLQTTVTDRAGKLRQYEFNANGIAEVWRENAGGTTVATKSRTVDSENRVTQIVQPEGNTEDRTYDSSNYFRWAQANVIDVTWTPKPGSPSTLLPRTQSFVWEPVFQHPCAHTDENGNMTKFFCDFMEGSSVSTDSNYNLDLIAQELRTTDTVLNSSAVGVSWSMLLMDQDLNGDGQLHARVQGKRIRTMYPTATLSTLGGTSGQSTREGDIYQEAIDSSTWNVFGQLTSTTDAEENTTVYLYYPEGDPDGDTYDNITTLDQSTGGYLKQEIEDVVLPYSGLSGVGPRPSNSADIGRDSTLDPDAVEKKTDWSYNRVGSVTQMTDPRGVRTDYSVNELDEVWKTTYAAAVDSSRNGGFDPGTSEPFTSADAKAYVEKLKYDEDGNLIQRLYQNSDVLTGDADTGAVSNFWETDYQYDPLDRPTQVTQELGTTMSGPSVTAIAYDNAGNVDSVTDAVGNVTKYTYDDRQLMSTVTVGYGATEALTTTTTYTDNGLPLLRTRGAGSTAGSDLFQYDGFDRLSEHINPIGTQTQYAYDPASNVTSVLRRGTSGGASQTNSSPASNTGSNVSIVGVNCTYDQRNRRVQQDQYDPNSTTSLTEGSIASDHKINTRFDHDRLGRLTFVVEDDAKATEFQYDGAGRQTKTIDAMANEVAVAYDDNDNAIKTTEEEQYPSAFVPSYRTYETFDLYDSLNRRVSTTDNIGQTQYFAYDSRGNMIQSWDAMGTTSGGPTINGHACNLPGSESRYWHDGENRTWREEHDVASNAANTDGKVRITQVWDAAGRLLAKSDDNSNASTWDYDALGRVTTEGFADLTSKSYVYDAGGFVSSIVDARGNQIDLGHDRAGRMTSLDTIPNVGTTNPYLYATPDHEMFEYNGLDLQTESDKLDVTAMTVDWAVTRTFDALGRLTNESQNGQDVASEWREEGKRTKLTYPSTLEVTYSHDNLDRISLISAASVPLASYSYAGPGRLLSRIIVANYSTLTVLKELHYDGASSSASDAAYYDAARRPIKMETVDRYGSTLYSAFTHGFDRNNMRTYEGRPHNTAIRGDRYTHDELSRLTKFERDLDSGGTPAHTKDWTLDGVHNWMTLTTDGTAQNNTVDAVNAYTQFGGTNQYSDLDGNLGKINGSSTVTLYYDVLNRLRKLDDGSATIEHDYDANGRRIMTTASGVSGQPASVTYYYDGWTVIEERNTTTSSVLRRFVNGASIDEPLRLENNSATFGTTGTYFYQRTSLGSVCAISDTSGAVVERYTYDAYGSPQFEDPSNAPLSASRSGFGNPLLYGAHAFADAPYPAYEYRNRTYLPTVGRFAQPDPLETWGDDECDGNSHAFVGSEPLDGSDSLGLQAGQTRTPPRYATSPTGTSTVRVIISCDGRIVREDTIPFWMVEYWHETYGYEAEPTFSPAQAVPVVHMKTTPAPRPKFQPKLQPYPKVPRRDFQLLSPEGSYTVAFNRGQVKYHGKGGALRALWSALSKAREYHLKLRSIQWTPAPSAREAFKDEDTRSQQDRGISGPKHEALMLTGQAHNLNMINSPGQAYKIQDGDRPPFQDPSNKPGAVFLDFPTVH